MRGIDKEDSQNIFAMVGVSKTRGQKHLFLRFSLNLVSLTSNICLFRYSAVRKGYLPNGPSVSPVYFVKLYHAPPQPSRKQTPRSLLAGKQTQTLQSLDKKPNLCTFFTIFSTCAAIFRDCWPCTLRYLCTSKLSKVLPFISGIISLLFLPNCILYM